MKYQQKYLKYSMLENYLKYKGKYLEAKYGGYTHKQLNIDPNDNEFVVKAIKLFNSEVGKYLKNNLDNLAVLIVSNNIAYQKAITKNEQFLLTVKKVYDHFLSFLKNQSTDFDMKEFIKMVNKNLDFGEEKFNPDDFDDNDDTILEIIIE